MSQSGSGRSLPVISPLRQRHHAAFAGSGKGNGRALRPGLMDVLEKNYGGDVTRMPYVVNKEAFK
ncbi:MAG TPA: hypothetical protein VJN64_03125 [Terriglobales bacterium]|nr:hypothetical protein [Terriglobales bacterium]